MHMHAHACALDDMKSLSPLLRRRPTNVTLSRKHLAMIDAFADFKAASGEMPPTRTWTIEQGLTLFFAKTANESSEFRQTLKDIEIQFRKIEEVARASDGRGV